MTIKMFSCKCLNFLVETTGTSAPVDPSTKSQLSSHAQRLELNLVSYVNIVKRVDVLVGLEKHHMWTEFHCRNCSFWVYACRSRESMTSHPNNIIVNKAALATAEDLDRKRRERKYSSIFGIILLHEPQDDYISGQIEPLHPLARTWLNQKRLETEARIKKFADHQYCDLEKKKAVAYSHNFALQRAVAHDRSLSQPIPTTSRESVERNEPTKKSPVRAPEKIVESSSADSLLSMDEAMLYESLYPCEIDRDFPKSGSDEDTIEQAQSSYQSDMPTTSMAGLPDILNMSANIAEGARGLTPPSPVAMAGQTEEARSSVSEEVGPAMASWPGEPLIVARSLPIPVPSFMEERHHDDRYDRSPLTPSDIHATIRALARSVHGDPIFGELPKPRFSKDKE